MSATLYYFLIFFRIICCLFLFAIFEIYKIRKGYYIDINSFLNVSVTNFVVEISMFTRLKNAVVALTSSDSANAGNAGTTSNHRSNMNRNRRTTVNKKCVSQHGPESCLDLPYNRPHFLSLNVEENSSIG